LTDARKIWIDCDPGVDDTVAIAMLTNTPQFEIVGISTVFGNATIEKTTRNAKVVMEAANLDHLPLARGASRPLCVPLDTSPFVHGNNGLGDMNLPETTMVESNRRAPQAIIDAILSEPHKITLLAIGPLTNLAIAYLLDEEICALVDEVVIMGGAVFCAGNITPAAEANFYHDPHAAQIVLSAGFPITLAGLDVNNQAMVPNALLEKVCDASKPLSPLIAGSTPFYRQFLESIGVFDLVDFPDALAAAYLLQPGLFTSNRLPVFVETEGNCAGQTLALPDGKWYQDPGDQKHFKPDEKCGVINILEHVDQKGFLALFEEILT